MTERPKQEDEQFETKGPASTPQLDRLERLANVAATAVGTVPSFELNRRWVWRRHGASSLRAEVVPFACLSAAGLVLSTLAVSGAGRWADHAALAGPTRTVAIQAASIGAFGALWLLQFAILDRVLFADRTVVGQDSRIPIPSR